MWEVTYTVCCLVGGALAASLYVWYQRPAIVVRGLMKGSMYLMGGRVRYITSQQRTYCYAERGQKQQNRSSLILIHGFTASKDQWLNILKGLPKDLHIIILDLPGHGNSSIPESDISIVSYTEYLREFFEATGLSQSPVHLAGTSMGGALVALYAATYPAHVERLTVICPAMLSPECSGKPKSISDLLVPCRHSSPGHQQFILGILQLRMPRNDFYQRLFDSINKDEGNMDLLLEKLTEITAPMQVVWGKNDQLLHISGVDVLRERVKTIEQVDLFDDCGHSVAMDRPGMLIKSLLQFRGELHSKDQ